MNTLKNDKSLLILTIIIFICGALAWTMYFQDYQDHDTVDIHTFPNQIGQWTAEEIPISDRDYAILETRNAFTRKYNSPDGRSVYLFIVYSQTNRKVVHPPEICYTGGGATILSNVHRHFPVPDPVTTITANKLVVEQGNYQQSMYYWFKVGETYTPNYGKGQVLIAINRLLGRPASGALIRLSATQDPSNPQDANDAIEGFAAEITPLLGKFLP